jgi:predicted nucleic acid-binding Zn ribbon protein
LYPFKDDNEHLKLINNNKNNKGVIYMAVEPHKHCPGCGSPMPMSEHTCSPRCQQIIGENEKKLKRTKTFLYIIFAIFIIAWLYFMLG